MTWYRVGTVSVTNGSATVTGSGTSWNVNASLGEGITLPDGRIYEIVGIASDTSLTISPTYLGSTGSGQAYAIAPLRGRIAQLLADTSSLLSTFATVRDGIGAGLFPDGTVGAPALRFSADQDTGLFRPGSNRLALVTNGVQRLEVDASGNALFAGALNAPLGAVGNPSYTFTGDTNTGMWSPAADTVAVSTGGAERVRVDASGNLGVGTTSPFAKIATAVSAGATFQNCFGATNGVNSDFVVRIQDNHTNILNSAGSFSFSTANAERMRITSSGGVAIGTTTDPGAGNIGLAAGGRLQFSSSAYITPENNVSGAEISTPGAITLRTNNAERMRIDSSGNVGIGTSSITGSRLQIKGANNLVGFYNDGLKVTSQNESVETQYSWWGINGGTGLTFAVGGTERARIDSSGNLLVGTTTLPNAGGNGFAVGISSTNPFLENRVNLTASWGHITFFNPNGSVGSITTSGSATAYNTSSDYRLKDIDGPIANSGAYIDALKPVQGSWKADGSRFIGLLAHEVQEVSETQIATGEKDGEKMQAMDYSAPELIANLIAELQSLRARVAQLEGNLQ